MRVPFAENAEIDIRKLTGYCLSTEHLEGMHKAVLWRGALGITVQDAEELVPLLLEAVKANDAQRGKFDRYGQRYVVDFELEWDGRRSIIRSGWIIDHGSNIPRLTTAYPK